MRSVQTKARSAIVILSLYFDGACEPVNPGGIATAGWILKGDGGKVIDSAALFVCEGVKATNNVAEYCALGFALAKLHRINWRGELLVMGDSQLVVNQVTKKWNCNKAHLRKLRDRCLELLAQVAMTWKAMWIPRIQNEEADAESRHAYREATGKEFPVRSGRT